MNPIDCAFPPYLLTEYNGKLHVLQPNGFAQLLLPAQILDTDQLDQKPRTFLIRQLVKLTGLTGLFYPGFHFIDGFNLVLSCSYGLLPGCLLFCHSFKKLILISLSIQQGLDFQEAETYSL
jgi:hypothetical protein